LAGWLVDSDDAERSVPGGGVIAGIGVISGSRCMVVANDSGINAGAIQRLGGDKLLRAQTIALENKLPFVQLIESAGANLLQYKVEGFINGGRLFYNLARLSAAGIPVLGLVHGSSTAGGAYLPGLSDYVIMVRERAKAFLAGPPLLKAATGEIAGDEELGGAQMHASVSGLGDYLAEDDADALRMARELAEAGFRALESPLPPNRIRDYQALKKQDALPILMDEGIVSPVEAEEFAALGMMDGIAMKVARCGGLWHAARIVDMLRSRSLLLFASGLTDPDLSLAASVHLFAAAGLARPAALNGPQFLEGRGVTDTRLRAAGDLIKVPTAPGLGIEVQGATYRTVAGTQRENGRRYG
jgi:hypothetical protein